MNIDYTVTALMFPAIPLLMSIYSNRFHSLSEARKAHEELEARLLKGPAVIIP